MATAANIDTQQQERTLSQSGAGIQIGVEDATAVQGAPVAISPQHFTVEQAAELSAMLETPPRLTTTEGNKIMSG